MNIAFPTTPIEIKAVTNAQGKFVLEGLISGAYSIQAKIEGYPIQFKSNINVVAGQTVQGINLVLSLSTGSISGMILDRKSGHNVPDSFVGIGLSGGNSGTAAYKITSDGTFLINKLQPGVYTAIVGAMNYLNSTKENIVVTEGQTTNITFYLDKE